MKIAVSAVFVLCVVMSAVTQSVSDSIISNTFSIKNPENVSFGGYGRASAYMLGRDYDYTTLFSEINLKASMNTELVRFHADLRFRTGLKFDETFAEMEIKELYASYIIRKFDISIGNQLVSWGRTDGFNPTANLNPVNYFFLSSDPDDQLMSSFMLRLRYRISAAAGLDIVGIPYYTASEYRHDLFILSPFAYFSEDETPSRTFENSAIGARLSFELPAAGFSLSYFNGYDPMQGFRTADIQWEGLTPTIRNAASPYRKQSFGIDMEIPAGPYMLRSEIAYNLIDDRPLSVHIPKSKFYYVAGIEREFYSITAIMQYIGRFTPGFEALVEPQITDYDPSDQQSLIRYATDAINYETALFNRKIFYQHRKADHALSLILNRTAFYELIRMELFSYYNFSSEELMFRPRITWRATDNLSFTFGGQYLKGPERSLFDYSGRVFNGIFMEMKAGF